MSRSGASADIFHAVADATRRDMLDFLARGEASVGAVVDEVGLSYSAVSQHLAVLSDAGLVLARAEGRQRLYRLDPGPLRAISRWVRPYEQFWSERLDRLEAHFETKAKEKGKRR